MKTANSTITRFFAACLLLCAFSLSSLQAQKFNEGYYRLKTMFRGNGECLEGNQATSSVHGGNAFMDKCQNVSGQLWKIELAQRFKNRRPVRSESPRSIER